MKLPQTQQECYGVYLHCLGWICSNWYGAVRLLNKRDTNGFEGDVYAYRQKQKELAGKYITDNRNAVPNDNVTRSYDSVLDSLSLKNS